MTGALRRLSTGVLAVAGGLVLGILAVWAEEPVPEPAIPQPIGVPSNVMPALPQEAPGSTGQMVILGVVPAGDLPSLPNGARAIIPVQSTPSGASRIELLQQALEGGEPVITEPRSGERPAVEGGEGGDLLPDAPPPGILDADGEATMRAAYQAYYEYRVNGFAHRSAVFRWQLQSSRVIFLLVVAIVGVGLYFSWMQFHHGLRTDKPDQETKLKASTTGFEVSSPVLGVIILSLSLAFFYLYLVHVYPIEEIF